MEWSAKISLYLGISIAIGVVLLIAVFVAVRYLWQRRQKPNKTIRNGILSQFGVSQAAPEFIIPLMIPLLIQDSLSSNEDTDVLGGAPIERTRSSTWQGTPGLIQPQDDREYGDQLTVEDGSGPLLRRLQSVTDVSIFPPVQAAEAGGESSGPWTSGVRRESLFFSATNQSSVRRSRTSTSGTTSGLTSPTSPSPKVEKKISAHQRVRAISEVSTSSCDNIFFSLRDESKTSTASDPEMGRKISETSRSKHRSLRKMISVPDGNASKPRTQFKKRFSETHRQSSCDSINSIGTAAAAKPAKPLPLTKRGRVVLAMKYDEKEKRFLVHLINATDLPMKNNNLLDSFPKLYLGMPTKQHRQQGKVLKKTCNPIFDEEFVFEDIDLTELLQSTLRIKIMNRDSGFTRGDVIGEAVVFLSDEDVLTEKTITKELLPKSSSGVPTEDGPGGELLLSVCHHATSAQLKVIVEKMKDLPKSCRNPTISIELLHKGETIQKQQTRSKKTKKNPDYHEEFNFHIPTSSSCTLERYSLQFSAYSQDILRGLICIGYVTLGQDAKFQSEVDHWRSVVSCPHEPITEWHKFHGTPL